MNNDWTPKEYNKLEDTDYKMEEYVRVPKDEYERLKNQTKIYQQSLYEFTHEIDDLQRNCDVFNEQMNDAVARAMELTKEKQDLKEWLKEEINKTNKTTTQVFRDGLGTVIILKKVIAGIYEYVLERLG
jgi:predicted  nucleic acid-binding Zn-ribbon protein